MTPRTQPIPPVPDHDDDVTPTRSQPPSIPPRRAVGAHPQSRSARPTAQASAGRTALPTTAVPVRSRHVPDAHAADDVAERIEERAPRPSVVQITASALAAVSSTVLLSYLGVAGTIVGAGIASVLTVLGNFVYQRSMLRAHEKVATALRTGARLGAGATAAEAARTTSVTRVSSRVGDGGARPSSSGAGVTPPAGPGAPEDAEGQGAKKRQRRRLVVAAIALFAVLVAAVTAVELVAGKPLTNLLHGTEGSGLSISDITRHGGDGGGSVPVPTSTTTEDPSDTDSSGSDKDSSSGTGSGSSDDSGSKDSGSSDDDSSGSTGQSGSGSSGSTDDSGSTGSGSDGSSQDGSTQDGSSGDGQSDDGSSGSSGGSGSTEPTSPATTQPTTSSDDAATGAAATSGADQDEDATS
ncbi:hypothetical protein GCM10023221_27180 [Luteimicrobium xylanilyticum]|uniref:Mucin-5AC n=1 Tax=Luteimicrobium xylanilyticum TaxID=1133546 RepID=A0A5P9QFH1_9MICO|nr:hypothetical protein [Luteimicrobium xylanilyticum]QFU99842.1 Mucin-5AC [Luteimicrobium xylanilyticum]